MKINALVEIGEEEVIKEIELPYFYKEGGRHPEGDFMLSVKVDIDQVTTITYRKEYNQTDLYDVKIEKSPADWMNTSDTYFFAGYKRNSSSARGFKLAHEKAMKWIADQQQLLVSIPV
jgi:hypothetical protein